MTKISTRLQVTPSSGQSMTNDSTVDVDALTRMDLKLTQKEASKTIVLAPDGKDVDFLYLASETTDPKTSVKATLLKADNDPAIDFSLVFPLVLTGEMLKLVGQRRELKVELTGDKKDSDVTVLVGRDG